MSQTNKVGVVSLYDGLNYGNILQNYAVHTLWRDLGFEPESLLFKGTGLGYLRTLVRPVCRRIAVPFSKKYRRLIFRANKLRKITGRLLPVRTLSTADQESISRLADEYTYFSVGSDQIWNPLFHNAGYRYAFMLPFARKEQRVCTAPSISLNELPDWAVPLFKDGLAGFQEINVREAGGARLIEALCGRKAEVLVDPTMALTPDAWLKFAHTHSSREKKNYIALYFLGPCPEAGRQRIQETAQRYNLDIIDFTNIDSEHYMDTPADFVKLLSEASLVCTDSFHGTVFSILFQRPFITFDRPAVQGADINSRSATLLNTFELQDRHASQIDWNAELLALSFEKAHQVLAEERQRFLNAMARQTSREMP